jgi:LCP family protein required for cell wall assembly
MKRRLVATASVAFVVIALGAVAWNARPGAAAKTGTPDMLVAKVNTGSGAPSFSGRVVLLAIGSDGGAPKFGRGGTASGGRADSIHLVIIDPATKRGTVIGFPRDSYVPIPGHGTDKINAAMSLGGPGLLVRTIEQLSGVRIDYYAVTSFDGLTDLVNGIGGVRLNVTQRIRDHTAGANLHAGPQRLNGSQALAYARARKTVPGGDLTRSRHQGQILIAGMTTFQQQIKQNPDGLMRWLFLARSEVRIEMPFSEQLRLALLARQIPARNLSNVVLPGSPGYAGSASVVRLSSEAYRILARARDGQY